MGRAKCYGHGVECCGRVRQQGRGVGGCGCFRDRSQRDYQCVSPNAEPLAGSAFSRVFVPSPSPAALLYGPRLSPSPAVFFLFFTPSLCYQAIVLSHEDASAACTVPYMSCLLRPLPVQEVLGRSAKREPKCSAKHAVYYWWKERRRVPPSVGSIPCGRVGSLQMYACARR